MLVLLFTFIFLFSRDRVPSPVLRLMGRLSALSAPSPSLWVQLRQCSPSNIEMPPSVPNHTRCCESTATPYTHSLTSSFLYVVNWPALSRRFAPAQVPIHIVPPGCSAKAYTQ